MQIEIVTIGNEVLSGRTLDTNFAFLARALEEASVQVGWHTTVSDTAERIGEGLQNALKRADAVVMTGGLGPTPDDVTRQAVSAALGRPLQVDESVLALIRERVRRLGRPLPPSVEVQALLPKGASAWPNRNGSAPGILIENDGKPVILLPGVPHEMEALTTEYVVPYLRERMGSPLASFTLRTAGIYETMLQEHIGDLPLGWPGATLAYLPSWLGVDLRVAVTGDDPEKVRTVAARAYEELRAKVEGVTYAEGSETMEQVVGRVLAERRYRIATAESCTGGLLAKRLTDEPGSSQWMDRGYVTYANRSKVSLLGVNASDLEANGAVSAPIAKQMAAGVRRIAGVEVGVGVTGIAGPDGGSEQKPVGTVFIGISTPGGDDVRKFRFAGNRRVVRERSAQTALDMVRRALTALPLEPTLD